jgi:type III secretory pathway component EscV
VQASDFEKIKDPHNWILQRKVKYATCIETPDGNAKAEIRMMYIWNEEEKDPLLVTNLARLSKGKMIGTRYNKDKEWVGGSVAYFEK